MKNLFLTKTRWLVTIILLTALGSGNAWGADAQCTLSNTNIVEGGTAAGSYGSKKMTDGCSQTWNAYAIKNQHSKSTSSYHFLQIKAYSSLKAYYVQVPEKTGYTIKSITMVVSSTKQPRTGGGNNATLFFSASNSTSSAGSGVASGTGSSSVTIDCSSLSLTTGYITASAAVRIWGDIVVTYTPSGAPSKVSTPTFSVAAGTYTGSQSVTLSCTTTGATIHYTTDGTTPTSSSPTYSSAITVDVTQTIKAIAIKDDMTNSDVAQAAYTIKCATPTFSPAAGTYGAVQSVSISTTYGTNIYYTTDGTTPTTSSTPYTSAISVSSTQTIKAIASKSGCSDSDEGSAAYTINIPYTVSFNTGTGNPSVASRTEASGGTGITLPSTSDLTPSCSGDGWTLYGWATSAYGSSSTTTAPTTTLAGLAGDMYYPSSNETLYAVYRKADGASESTSTTYTINGNWTTDNGNWTKVAGNDLNGALASGKYGLNSGSSSATSPVSYSEISAIQFTGTKSGSGKGSVEFLYGSGSSWTSLGSKNIANTLTWSVDPTVSGDLKIVFTRTNGNIYIASIKVTYTNASYVYWSNPNCCTSLGTINGSINLSQLATPDPTKLKASWAMNAETGIASYTLEVYDSSDNLVKTINNYTSGSEITGLTPCTEYYVKLYTVSSGGEYCDGGLIGTSGSCTTNGYTLKVNKSNVSLNSGSEPTNICGDVSATYAASAGYTLPTSISVTNAGAENTGWTWNSSTGALTINKASVTGNVTVTITGTAQSNFPNNKTIFIQAHSTSAWTGGGCVKAWFHSYGGSETAQPTYWLFDAGSPDEGKKLFAAIVPTTGDLPYLDIQRFAANCSDWWNKNGGCSYSDAAGSNTIRSEGSGNDQVYWNASGVTLSLYGDPNSWASSLGTFADQGAGIWTATYNNYAPANAAGETQNFKISTNYNGWIGNTGSNNNATLDGMHVGSTYNITATLDVKDHSLTMSKTFVKGTVHFDLQGHGSTISDLTNVAAGSKISAPSPAPSATGWDFGGWYKEPACTNEWNFASDVVNETMTLYAKWTQVYTVTYNYNGGTSSCADANKYAAGTTVAVCSTPPTKAGSTFQGWLGDNNIGTKAAGSTFTMPAANVTLTAQWTDTKYTLTQTTGSHTTKGHTGTVITSGMTSSSGLDLTYSISDNGYALPKAVTISGGGQTWTLGTNYTWELSADKHSATLHIGADLTISADVIITVTEQARYTVVWDEHGNTTTDYYAADDNSVTMKSGIADCGEKKFYGWTEDAEFVSNPTTPPTMASSGVISSNKHYYAIFGDKAGGDGFVLVTSIIAGEGYYMATGLTSSDKVYTGQKATNEYGGCTANNSTGSSFSGETLLAFPPEAKSLTVAISNGNFSLYDGTSYLGAANSNSLTFNDAPVYEWKLSDNKIQSQSYTSRYIKRNTANDRVCAYASTSGVADMHLYKPNVSWTNFSKTCTLYNITINTPSGGTVTTTPAAGTGVAGEGQTVTVNVTPNSCKYLSALKYNDGSDHAINIAAAPYTFTMPASNVTVTATFADKTVSRIDPVTSTNRALMQNTSFVGEQIRVTYNNGETEDLAWDNASLTFSGYDMSTLGEQTVSVAYSGSCGSANTSYEIEITDGIPVTFSDCGNTTVRKYDPGDVVPVETTAGEYACSGWEFVGWSESSVAANSTSFTPVRNFTASSARTLYAVYANVGTDWISAFNTSELRGGATYVIVYKGYSYDYALLNTVASTNYLNGQQLATACSTITESGSPSKDRYVLKDTPTAAMKWQLVPNGDYYSLYNAATNKYLKITTDQHALLTSSCDDKFTVADGYNDSQLTLKSFNASASNYYLYWYNSGRYFEGWTTAQGLFLLTNVKTFSSNPPCAPRSVTFHGNGGTVTASGGGSSGGNLVVTEAARDAGINLPTASIDAEDCEGNAWNFFGWIDHPVDVTRVPILTTDMLNDGYNPKNPNPHYDIVTDNDEFWAVYTNTGAPETKYGTISFKMSDFNLSYSSTEYTTRKTVTNMGEYAFGYVNLGHSSQKGIEFKENTGELYNKTSLGKVNSISFTTFSSGDINKLKVYVGNEEKTTDHQLTAAEMQNVGSTWTYYPTENESYFYITNVGIGNGSYVCVSGISVDFGRGTTVYATTPVCSTISLSGDVYVTSRNGVGIMAATPLSVEAHQLAANADVVITSNSTDVYFSKDRNANFAKAAANQPKNSVTVTANASGELDATPIYVHYKPSSTGTGAASDVTVYANLSPANPNIKGEHTIHVRNLPEKFVIAAKVGGAYYALPADMNTATNPSGVVIEVDEMNMTAVAPNTCSYTIWPVKTTNTDNDRYALQDGNAYGERVRFAAVNNNDKALWANDAASGTTIKNWAYIKRLSDGSTGDTGEGTNSAYEWKITTTVVDGNWQYTLQTDQTINQKYLRYWSAASGGPKWGTYASGEQNLYFLPVTEVEPFEMQVVEWYPTKVLVQTEAALASPSVKVNGEAVASPVLTNKGGKLWEISGLPLESNPTRTITVSFTADEKNYACSKAIPVILSRSTNTQASEPFTRLGAAIYNNADLVVRDGAVLTVEGSNVANTFNDVTIYPTSKISVPSDKKLTVHSLTFFGGIDEIYDGSAYAINKYGVPELSLKGTLHKSIAQIDYVMRVDDSQMYSLTVPYDVNLADITYWDGTNMGTPGDKLWVSAYDGDARAKKDMSHTWIWEADFQSKFGEAKLKAGVGYTISAYLQAGVGSTYSILRMPMASNVANDGTELAKTVPVVAHGINSDVSDNHKGWNLVGNPYMVAISGAEADSKLVVGYLKETGTGPWEWVDTYRYVTIPNDNGTDYYQAKFSSATLKPFKNFFLQIATSGDLSFALASRQNSPARYLEAQKREVEFEINLANGSHQDHTGLLIAEEYSPAYEINADLEKMIGSMSVYTIYGGYNLAYNALSPDDAKQFIPIGYVAPSAGEYTFSLDDNSDVKEIDHIYLTDYQESVTVDLMEQDYIFMTTSGKNESRFAINATLKEENDTPTDIDIINGGGDLDGEKPIKFIYHDKMYIYHRGVIYDATGKKVK